VRELAEKRGKHGSYEMRGNGQAFEAGVFFFFIWGSFTVLQLWQYPPGDTVHPEPGTIAWKLKPLSESSSR
jgi:hypothetical protein